MTQLTPKKHLLTVLVEDYFHVGAFGNLIQQRNWENFEPRYEQNTLKTLDLLDEFKTRATFFVLGWIAEQNPALIREIAARGHEVASRGFYHRGLANLTADEFREDVRRAGAALEAACGQEIIGYRAAEKLSFEKDAWVLDVLTEEGYVYDASFLPSRQTDPTRRVAHQIPRDGRVIWEFPYATRNFGVGLLPISGGNYFRQIPYTLMRRAVREWHETRSEPFVFYFHVWELDPAQPRINAASPFNRIRHYRKLDKMEWILRENLGLYEFSDASRLLGLEPTVSPRVFETNAYPAPRENSAINLTGGAPGDAKPVSIVIPCYNEEAALTYLANTLRSVETELNRHGWQPQFIFVDDCSTDSTVAKINALFGARPNVRLVRHEQNQGVAAGIMTGLRAAETEVVCSMDCDCTYDPHELVRMLPLLTDDVDLVTASPYHRDGGVRNVPGWRLLLSRGASWLYRRALHAKLATYTSCFRVYRRAAVIQLNIEEKGFLGVAELLGKLDLAGGKIIEFPAVLEVRLFGFSKMKTARTIFGHLKLLSRLVKSRIFRNQKSIGTNIKQVENGTKNRL